MGAEDSRAELAEDSESLPTSPGPSIVLFGPQAVRFSNRSFSRLREAVQEQDWAITTLSELPRLWQTASKWNPSLHSIPGDRLLAELRTWLTDPSGIQFDELPMTLNIFLAPLTTLAHLTQYRRHVENCYPYEQDPHGAAVRDNNTATLGFCTGLLAAFATSSAANSSEWSRLASVAVRLAAVIGGAVDAMQKADEGDGASESYGVLWRNGAQGRRQLEAILTRFSKLDSKRGFGPAYVSVWYDHDRATVTVSRRSAKSLLKALGQADITAAPTGLCGRFHSMRHRPTVDAMTQLCAAEPALLALSDASMLFMPTYNNSGDGQHLRQGALHELAIRALLEQPCDWYGTLSAVLGSQRGAQGKPWFQHRRVVPISHALYATVLPPSFVHCSGSRFQAEPFDPLLEETTLPRPDFGRLETPSQHIPRSSHAPMSGYIPHDDSVEVAEEDSIRDHDIAIVGMSIKVAGAEDLAEYEAILHAGKSQHQQVPRNRVSLGHNLWRFCGKGQSQGEEHKWYGNFIRDVDAFDHKFFGKSPRESAAMDPQQRLLLEAAYQAVEQSGYYTSSQDKHVGVYVGTCATDYDHNAACHTAGAFTSTGLLRGFIAGRVSHYFGWTGPSMTFDTACSGSAVAIHSAVRAIVSGECSAALAGGVNIIGSEMWFQNLAGAQFLSSTGQCKPFDEAADGYCRGEGISCVFLKSMATALADGNQVLGRIASTAVYQNDNRVPLFVPHAPSLSCLFDNVVRDAGLEPQDISFVEAHVGFLNLGTGTPAGDPVEYQAIRESLGGPLRHEPLSLGSVKGLVGHTESASGVVSLVKVVLMMRGGYIPPQPSHSKLSRHIGATSSDMVQVSTTLRPWRELQKAALINNYGAAGSNAAIVVTQAPSHQLKTSSTRWPDDAGFPFWISGHGGPSIAAYCAKLADFVTGVHGTTSVADICFNVSRQSNRSLSHAFLFRSRTTKQLKQQLSSVAAPQAIRVKAPRPVILCFGGQNGDVIHLDRSIYDAVPLFRRHMDECDDIFSSLGMKSIFPDIFLQSPTLDAVHLQTMLFALQYACAMTWITCGLPVKAVIGHSFGEITALCISQVLELRDAIKLVTGRARIVTDYWGPDRGLMLAVEGEPDLVQKLLQESNSALPEESSASIACYNGPRSFTLAGSTPAMDQVALTLATGVEYTTLKSKALSVSNAFHSSLVDPLFPRLDQVGAGLKFRKAQIRVERATERALGGTPITARFVAEHMRRPVFFYHAAQRLAHDFPAAIWVEAGSDSKITSIARRSVKPRSESHFQGISLTDGRGLDQLANHTLVLWKQGIPVTFWPHYGLQATHDHEHLLLPQFQFEKSRHWLDAAPPLREAIQGRTQPANDPSLGILSFMGYRDPEKRQAWFTIDTRSESYKLLVLPHVAAKTAPICPATLMYSMAVQALRRVSEDNEFLNGHGLRPIVREMRNEAPLCVNFAYSAWLELEAEHGQASPSFWTWRIVSTLAGHQPNYHDRRTTTLCVRGKLELRSGKDTDHFAQYEQIATHKQCLSMLENDDEGVDSGLQGRSIYSCLVDVVDYGEIYRRVRRVVGRGNESAGIVVLGAQAKSEDKEGSWLEDVPVLDAFSQVAGIWVNCMTDRVIGGDEIFLATGCETIISSPISTRYSTSCQRGNLWHVLAKHRRESERTFLTDVFVFDSTDGRLMEVVLGIRYDRIPKLSMSRQLVKLTDRSSLHNGACATLDGKANQNNNMAEPTASEPRKRCNSNHPLHEQIKDLVSSVSEVTADDITDEANLTDLGIDSLAAMELAYEFERVFGFKTDLIGHLRIASSFGELIALMSRTVHGQGLRHDSNSPRSEDTNSDKSRLSAIVPSIIECTYSHGEQGNHGASKAKAARTHRMEPIAESGSTESQLGHTGILAAFAQIKATTDDRIRHFRLEKTDAVVVARSTRLCVALVVEALAQLGCSLLDAAPGQLIRRVKHSKKHSRLVNCLYGFLAKEGRLIDIDGSRMTRTANITPCKSSHAIYQELVQDDDGWSIAHRLTYYAGGSLADVLSGKKEGIRVLFGSPKGLDLVQKLYHDLPFNVLFYEQMRDYIRLLAETLPTSFRGPLRILEMGAGTGGTTHSLAPLLSSLQVPIEYTVTDLSQSMLSQTRRFMKTQYPFIRFAVHDIEQAPVESLRGTQHIVIASNAVHATANLTESLSKMRTALRSDGILLLAEMTESLPFVDLVFGLLDGWWRFADGREKAIVPVEHWRLRLHEAGFGHVDWTDGLLTENRIQRVIMALPSELTGDQRPPTAKASQTGVPPTYRTCNFSRGHDVAVQEAEAKACVTKYSAGFMAARDTSRPDENAATDSVRDRAPRGCAKGAVVIVTGATGSLGCHLVARFAEDPIVDSVICLNRPSHATAASSPLSRQQQTLSSRGIILSAGALAKLRVFAAKTAELRLGLERADYAQLVSLGTHIVHAAWPMSATRPLRAFDLAMRSMRRLLDLAADISTKARASDSTPGDIPSRVCFQLISSIGVVGCRGGRSRGQPPVRVAEERVDIGSVLPNGYCMAKWVCERLLDETLHRYPARFRAMAVRPGQIAGSSVSGAWNSAEHFALMVRSAETLCTFPALHGTLQWLPVDVVAETIAELALSPEEASGPVYHVDNPVGQSWGDMVPVLIQELRIPHHNVIPFSQWIRIIRRSPLDAERENPALKLVDFLEQDFERMSCGGIILDTSKAKQHSPTLAAQGPVSVELARRYIRAWRVEGFLSV